MVIAVTRIQLSSPCSKPYNIAKPSRLEQLTRTMAETTPKIVTIIPARMASTRLPGKPLADIHGQPLIVHVWRRAMDAKTGPVLVACAEQEIADAVTAAGGEAVLTDPDLPSGSDRIWQALCRSGHDDAEIIINLQGDEPTVEKSSIEAVLALMTDPAVDIGTLAVEISEEDDKTDPSVVKAIFPLANGAKSGRALYFTRSTAPSGEGPLFHHIGLYAYRRAALARFVALPPGQLEQREKLEQLRALEDGMRIDVGVIDTVPLGVDTPADLEKARKLLQPQS
jgi:3-deoxy-manno-octulosonate cytidylyltransferase (CMP-KDO synthetase)